MHRLFSIMQPPLEAAHNWRQSTVCMVARNFLEVDANIFYPRVDMAGELSGITGMEFPLFNYLIYLVSLVFGYEHWYGRLINLIVTSLGIYCFYKYLKNVINSRIAFNTSIILIFSIWYFYSRKIMPDTIAIGLIMIGAWSWYKFITYNQWGHFILGGVLILCGVLSKLPSIVFLAFLWPLIKTSNQKQLLSLGIAIIINAVASYGWYFIWIPKLNQDFSYEHFFMGESIASTVGYLLEQWPEMLHIFYQKAIGFTGFAAFVIGIYFLVIQSRQNLIIAAFSLLLFIGFLLKSGSKFVDHEYYIIPIIPFMSLSAAYALNNLSQKLVLIALLAIAVEGITRKWEDQFIKSGKELVVLEDKLEPFVETKNLIAINSGEYPTPLYFAHRKGWVASNEQLSNPKYLNQLQLRGCQYILILKQRFGSEVQMALPKLHEDDLFALYALSKNLSPH